MERKLLITAVVVGAIALFVGVFIGVVFGFASTLPQMMELKDENTWLKEHSFTYYTVGNAINITDLEITTDKEFFLTTTYIKGNITNISDKAIETVYVYLILRNPDGTADFDPYDYEVIENLYIGETTSFEFTYYDGYDESQTVEIFLAY